MALTRKRIVTGLSVVYLLALTILAAYALHSVTTYKLPIPNIICALTIALPSLAGVGLEAVLALNEKLAAKGELQKSRIFQVVIAFFLVFESVLATLAGTHHSPPGSLTCALRDRWQELFSGKNADAIRRIQNDFSCCGFANPLDMSWPFKDASHENNACLVRYERDTGCVEPWRDEERKVAIMLMIVPVAVFIWKVAIILAPSSSSSWLPSHIRLPSSSSPSEEPSVRRPRPAIAYRDVEEQGEDDSLAREVTNLNKDSQLATHVETNRTRSAGLLDQARLWQE